MMYGPGGVGSSDDPPTPPTPPTDPDQQARVRELLAEARALDLTQEPAPQRRVNPGVPRGYRGGESYSDPTTAPSSLDQSSPLLLADEDPSTPHTHSGPRPTPASNVPLRRTLEQRQAEQGPAERPEGLWARLRRWLGL